METKEDYLEAHYMKEVTGFAQQFWAQMTELFQLQVWQLVLPQQV